MKTIPRRVLGACGLAWLLAAAPAHAQRVTYSGSASYSGGTYIFDTRSDNFMISNGLRVGFGPVTVGFSVPVLIYNGGLVTTVAKGVPLPTGGTQGDVVRDRVPGDMIGTRGKGRQPMPEQPIVTDTVVFQEDFQTNFGDPYLNTDAEIYSGFGALRSISLNGTAKIPLADVSTGISSGKWDFGAGASVILSAGRAMLLADVAYWWLGDMPDLVLNDGLSYALGISVPAFSGRGSVMGLLSGMSKTIDNMESPVTLTGSLGRSIGERLFMNAGIGFGLTESAPDFYATLGWSVRLDSMGR
jgi:hypothetical protein